jgi:site-specific DNA-cytosine methylase
MINMSDNLKRQLCNELIRQGKVQEGDVIRHSYTNSRFNSFHIENKDNHNCCSTLTTRADCIGVVENKPCPTLDTRCDCLGVVVNDIDNPLKGKEGSGNMLKVIESEPKINVVGNYKPSGYCTGRVITSDVITPTIMENHGAIQAILENKENEMEETQVPNYRIRKLTPKECFRLMGIKDEDFEKIQPNQSNAGLYHLAGDSIVTTCMMGIFGELFNVPDYRDKIENLLKGLS